MLTSAELAWTEDAGDGTYTGSHRLARGSTEGMHSVTVTINGVSLAADDMLTVDNTMPSVTVTAPAAGITVINGQDDYHYGYCYGRHRCNRYRGCLHAGFRQQKPIRLC